METKAEEAQSLAQTKEKASGTMITEAIPAPAHKDPAPEVADAVSDPDEDDLDDLDDMLDEFNSTISEPKAPSGPSGPGRPEGPPSIEGISDEDFTKQLQAGMADLLGELETSPDMQAQFESMLKELGSASGEASVAEPGIAPQASTSSTQTKARTSSTTAAMAEETFQETIKKTMERMQASGESATAAAGAAGDNPDDLLAEMMKAMQASGLDGEGGEEDFSKMLLGMMEQLTNKEILYEPMKELDDKFPAWMEKNASTEKEEDLKRYKEQQTYVREIVERFEAKGYSDDNAKDREYIVDRMQKMQGAGSPPADLVGDMAAAQEAFGAPEEGCPQQ